jgi:hypothetical protein
MKRYGVSHARRRLAEVLDEADQGHAPIIERNGVQYKVSLQTHHPRATRVQPAIEVVDPAVASGEWTWTWRSGGLSFRSRPR